MQDDPQFPFTFVDAPWVPAYVIKWAWFCGATNFLLRLHPESYQVVSSIYRNYQLTMPKFLAQVEFIRIT
jgi:hypothetical protein